MSERAGESTDLSLGEERATASQRWRRVVQRLTVLLVLVALSLSFQAFLPALGSPSAVPAARRGLARALRLADYAVGPPEPRLRSPIEQPAPLGGLLQRWLGDGKRGAEPRNARPMAVVRSKVAVFDRAEEGASVLAELPAGTVLMVVQEAESWVLVAWSGDDGVQLGWASRDSVAILPR